MDKDVTYTVLKVNSEPFSVARRRSGSLLECDVNALRERTNDGGAGDLRACRGKIYDIAQFADLSNESLSLHRRLNLYGVASVRPIQRRDISITISVFRDPRKIVYQRGVKCG